MRRAPRLAPHERLGALITRRGRFLSKDPLEGIALPSAAKVLGVAGWAGLAAYAFWSAVRTAREETPAP